MYPDLATVISLIFSTDTPSVQFGPPANLLDSISINPGLLPSFVVPGLVMRLSAELSLVKTVPPWILIG